MSFIYPSKSLPQSLKMPDRLSDYEHYYSPDKEKDFLYLSPDERNRLTLTGLMK
jgi:ubiquinone biosynthesis protein COQ9